MRPIQEITFFTDQLDEMIAFYTVLLDGAPVFRNDSIGLFQSEGLTLLIHAILEELDDGLPYEDHFAIPVMDLDVTASHITQQGVAFAYPAKTYEWGRSAYLRDPDGRLLEIMEKERG